MKTILIFAVVFVSLLVYSSGQRRPSSWDSTRFGQRDWGRDRFGQDWEQNDRGQNTFRRPRPDTTQPDRGQNDRGQGTSRSPRPDTTQPDQGQNNRGQNTFRSLRPDTTPPPAIVGHVPGQIGHNRGFDQRGPPGKETPPPLPPVLQDQGQTGQRRETGTGSRESSEVPYPVDEAFEMTQSGRPEGRGQPKIVPSAQPPAKQVPAKVEEKEVSTPQHPKQQEGGRRTTSGTSVQVLPTPTPQSVVGQYPGQRLGSSSRDSSSFQSPISQVPPKVGQKEISTPQHPPVDKGTRQQEVGRRTTSGSSGQVLPSPTPQSVMGQHPGQQFGSSSEISSPIQPPISEAPPKVGQKGIPTPQNPSVDKDLRQQGSGSSGQVLPSPTPQSVVGQHLGQRLGSSSRNSSLFQPAISQVPPKVGQKEISTPQHPPVDKDTRQQEEGRRTTSGSSGQVLPSPTPQSVVGQHPGQQLGSSSSIQPPTSQTPAKVGQRDKNKETQISTPPNSSTDKNTRQKGGRGTLLSQGGSSGPAAPSLSPQSRTGQHPGQQLSRSGEREILPSSQPRQSQGHKGQNNGRGSNESAIHHANRQPSSRELGGGIEPQSQLEGPEHKESPKPSKSTVEQDQRQTGSRQNKIKESSPKIPGEIDQTGVLEQRNTPKQLQPPISQLSNRSRQNGTVERRGLSNTVGQRDNPVPQSLPKPPTSQNSNNMREGGGRTPQNRQVFGQNNVPITQQRGVRQRNGEREILRSKGRGGGIETTTTASRPPRMIQKGIWS